MRRQLRRLDLQKLLFRHGVRIQKRIVHAGSVCRIHIGGAEKSLMVLFGVGTRFQDARDIELIGFLIRFHVFEKMPDQFQSRFHFVGKTAQMNRRLVVGAGNGKIQRQLVKLVPELRSGVLIRPEKSHVSCRPVEAGDCDRVRIPQ